LFREVEIPQLVQALLREVLVLQELMQPELSLP
jgi:hypothetical protein